MNENELAELRTEADKVAERDHHLGTVLHSLITHVARAHGLDLAADASTNDEEDEAPAQRKGKVK